MGGILTDLLSWEWIFFVNVPIGIAALILSPILLSESKDAHGQSHDVLAATLVTGGLVLLVLGITDLFPGFLILGVAIPFAFVPITIAALVSIFLVRGRDLRPQEKPVAEPVVSEPALEEAA